MNKMKQTILMPLAAAILFSLTSSDAEVIPITNAQFGSDSVGSLNGWSTAGSTHSSYVRSDSGTGPLMMIMFGGGISSTTVAYCSQTLSATIEGNNTYTFSFDIQKSQIYDVPALFEARLYAGSTLLTAVSATTPSLTNSWQQWSYDFQISNADASIGSPIKIEFFSQAKFYPAGTQRLDVDNVSLNKQSTVPEPSTIALIAITACGLLAYRKTRKK